MMINPQTQPLIAFCPNTSLNSGLGHFMRCKAIAEAWESLGRKSIFINESEKCSDVIRLAKQAGTQWVVLDGYNFGDEFECNLKKSGFKVLAIDDYGHAQHIHADLVLNHNPYGSAEKYPQVDKSKFIGGHEYVLIRNEFQKAKSERNSINRVPRVIVTFGGEDKFNATLFVAEALQGLETPPFHVSLLVGPRNTNLEEIERFVAQNHEQFDICKTPNNISRIMANADFAVSACGSTTLELLYLDVPATLIITADNQKLLAEYYTSNQLHSVLGTFEGVSKMMVAEKVRSFLQNPKKPLTTKKPLIDGLGASRVCQKILENSAN